MDCELRECDRRSHGESNPGLSLEKDAAEAHRA